MLCWSHIQHCWKSHALAHTILLSRWVTVYPATLIFISGRGSTTCISSAQEGRSGNIRVNMVNKLF